MYSEDRDAFMVLNVEQRGMLLTSLFDSSVGVEPKFNDDMVKALWLLLWPKQIRNNNKYEAECEKKRKAGRKGGKQRAKNASTLKHTQADASTLKHTQADASTLKQSKLTITETITKTETETKDTCAGDAARISFDDFWKSWPAGMRKVNKKGCAAKWKRIIAEGADPSDVMRGLEAAKLTDDWRRGYVPLPMTWLNQERWTAAGDPDVSADLGQASEKKQKSGAELFDNTGMPPIPEDGE